MIRYRYFNFVILSFWGTLVLFSGSCSFNKDLEEVHINFIKLSKLGSKIKSYFNLNISESETYINSKDQAIIFSNSFINISNKVIKHLSNLNKNGSRILEINLRKYQNILVDLNEVYINLNLNLISFDSSEKENLAKIREDLIKKKSELSSLLTINNNLVKTETIMY